MLSTSPSPTGLFIVAQGNALGRNRKENGRLKACVNRRNANRMKQAFSLHLQHALNPRALPWARMNEPVGLTRSHLKEAPFT